jgi:hypothetical protein
VLSHRISNDACRLAGDATVHRQPPVHLVSMSCLFHRRGHRGAIRSLSNVLGVRLPSAEPGERSDCWRTTGSPEAPPLVRSGPSSPPMTARDESVASGMGTCRRTLDARHAARLTGLPSLPHCLPTRTYAVASLWTGYQLSTAPEGCSSDGVRHTVLISLHVPNPPGDGPPPMLVRVERLWLCVLHCCTALTDRQ